MYDAGAGMRGVEALEGLGPKGAPSATIANNSAGSLSFPTFMRSASAISSIKGGCCDTCGDMCGGAG